MFSIWFLWVFSRITENKGLLFHLSKLVNVPIARYYRSEHYQILETTNRRLIIATAFPFPVDLLLLLFFHGKCSVSRNLKWCNFLLRPRLLSYGILFWGLKEIVNSRARLWINSRVPRWFRKFSGHVTTSFRKIKKNDLKIEWKSSLSSLGFDV